MFKKGVMWPIETLGSVASAVWFNLFGWIYKGWENDTYKFVAWFVGLIVTILVCIVLLIVDLFATGIWFYYLNVPLAIGGVLLQVLVSIRVTYLVCTKVIRKMFEKLVEYDN